MFKFLITYQTKSGKVREVFIYDYDEISAKLHFVVGSKSWVKVLEISRVK